MIVVGIYYLFFFFNSKAFRRIFEETERTDLYLLNVRNLQACNTSVPDLSDETQK